MMPRSKQPNVFIIHRLPAASLTLSATLVASLLGCHALAQTQPQPTKEEIITEVQKRDAKISSVQMAGVLEQESSSDGIRKSYAAIDRSMPPNALSQQAKNAQIYYYAAHGEKEALATQSDTTFDKSASQDSEALAKMRDSLFQKEPKVYDGQTNYFLSIGRSNKTIKMHQKAKDSLFGEVLYGFRSVFDRHSLTELLQGSDYKIVGYEQDDRFGTLAHLQGSNKAGKQNDMWIAPAKDCLIVKESEGDKYTNLFEVNEVVQVAGFWIPKIYRYSVFTAGSQSTPMLRSTSTRTFISVNDVPDTIFQVKQLPGDKVNDMSTGQWWIVAPGGERLYQQLPNDNAAQTMSLGWLYMTSITSLLVLTVGAYVRWKRNQ